MKLSIPVLINNIYYNSINIAAHKIGVDNRTIVNRINSNNFPGYSFTEYRPPIEKRCSLCNQIKSLEQFKKVKRNRDGRSSWCKKCHSIETIKSIDKEKHRINNHKWGATEKGKLTRKLAKETRRANETSSIVALNKDEKQYIKWLHGKVKIMRKYGFDVHLDHIIPISKGGLHIPDNLQIIPAEDNLKKNNIISH